MIWKLPPGTFNPKVGSHITKMMRDLEDGLAQVGLGRRSRIRSSPRPTPTTGSKASGKGTTLSSSPTSTPPLPAKVADLILPSAIIFEKWGAYGNSERRTQAWREMVPPPGEARSDVWQMLEFSKRFTLKEVWGAQAIPGLTSEGFEDGRLPDVLAEAEKTGILARRHAIRRSLCHTDQSKGDLAGSGGRRPGEPHRGARGD